MTTKWPALLLLGLGTMTFCTGGCGREPRERAAQQQGATPVGSTAAETTLTSASAVNGATAIDDLVAARCARAVSCNEVGPQARFESQGTCARRVDRTMRGKLTPNECPAGVSQGRLEACVQAVARAPCDMPLDVLDEVGGCGLGELCPVAPRP